MQPRETVVKTIARMGREFKKLMQKGRNVQIEIISGLVSTLFDSDIQAYDKTYEVIERLLNEKPAEQKSGPINQEYEYKWALHENEVFGPFPGKSMKAWNDAGFFKSGVYIRKVLSGESFTKMGSDESF